MSMLKSAMCQNRKGDENKNKEKQFVHRNSVLTDLFDNVHIKTVYNLFVAFFIGLFINTALSDYLKNGKTALGLKLIGQGFGGIHLVLLIWIGLFSGAVSIYWCFNIWIKIRKLLLKLQLVKMWDIFCVLALAAYYISSFRFSSYLLSNYELGLASRAIIMGEQSRLLMKIHSFVRSNAPKVLNHKPHTETELILPNISSYLFFMFVPTLIYRDTYPRTKTINWNFVFFCFLEFISAIFFMSFITNKFIVSSMEDFCIRKWTVNEMILCLFENSIAGFLLVLTPFFLIYHSWMNLFAEITRFGDRLFYEDWWTATDFSVFFRKWNVLVQDWLYIYVYKEGRNSIFRNRPQLARFSVFFLSAITHEVLSMLVFGFFLPFLLVEFLVFGSILSTITAPKRPLSNILFWYFISLGFSSLLFTHVFELYARMNVPILNPTLKDMFIPRFLSCIDFN